MRTAVLRVPAEYPTIQSAIDAAPDSATILIADGVFTGPGNWDIETRGRPLTVRSENLNPDLCIVDVGSVHSAFLFHANEDSSTSVVGLGIRNGGASHFYGAVSCVGASPRIINCTISDCYTGIQLTQSSAVVRYCRIFNNELGVLVDDAGSPFVSASLVAYNIRGFFIRDGGTATVDSCSVMHNFDEDYFNYGAGIYCEGSVLVRHTILSQNKTFDAGLSYGVGTAVYGTSADIVLQNCTIVDNGIVGTSDPHFIPDLHGSAIFCENGGTLAIERSVICYNWTTWGVNGSVATDGSVFVTISQSDVYGNHSGDYTEAIAGQEGINGNVSADPLFCDLASGALTLVASSPCVIGADFMGALPVGCQDVLPAGGFELAEALPGAQNLHRGAGWGDYDQDGDDDLYVVREDAPYSLYRNDGNGVLSDVTPVSLAITDEGVGCDWVDYDDDGDLDLFVINYGSTELFRNDGDGHFVATGEIDVPFIRSSSWIDLDSDGDLDVFLDGYNGPNFLYLNSVNGFVNIGCDEFQVWSGGRGVAFGDYDGDGDPDAFFLILGGSRLLRNDGMIDSQLTFTNVTDPMMRIGGDGSAVWGDYDLDGNLDLYVSRSRGNKLFRNDGHGGFSDASDLDSGALVSGKDAVWFDYDRDGYLDLYIHAYSAVQANSLRRNVPGGRGRTFEYVPSSVLGSTTAGRASATADFDGDGRPDLFGIEHTVQAAQPDVILSRASEENHWIAVNLRGRLSNSHGVGSAVSAYAEGMLIAYHEIGGGSSPSVHSSLTALLGLGRIANLDSLVIEWSRPAGRQVVIPRAVDTEITIVEQSDVWTTFRGWQMRQRDMQHTGRADFTVPPSRLNESFFDVLAWQAPTPGSPDEGALGATSMIFAEGYGDYGADLVVGTYHWPKGLQGMNRRTGAIQWHGLSAGGERVGDRTPAFASESGHVFFTNDATESPEFPDGHPAMAFYGSFGPDEFYWHNGGDVDPRHLETENPVIAPDGRIFLHGWLDRPRAAAFVPGVGIRETWVAGTEMDCLATDVALYEYENELRVVAAGEYGGLACWDGSTGAEVWRVALPQAHGGPTIDPASGDVYVAAGEGSLWIAGVDRDGGALWGDVALPCYLEDSGGDPRRVFGTGCLSHDGRTYYFPSAGLNAPGALYAIDTVTGGVKWTFETGSMGWDQHTVSSPIVTRNGVVIIGGDAACVYYAIADRGAHAELLDTLEVAPTGNARASATLAVDGLMYLPVRMQWMVPGGMGQPSGEIENLFCAFDLASDDQFAGMYAEDFDLCQTAHTTGYPGRAGHRGWYSVLAMGGAYGEIQSSTSLNGKALHEHSPSTNEDGMQSEDGHDLNYTLVGRPTIVLSGAFYAHSSSLAARNPYDASVRVTGGPEVVYELIGLSVDGGNGAMRSETGVSVNLAAFNGYDNNDPISLQVGQQLAWDAWHQFEIALDHGGDTYLYLTVDGESQDLHGYRPPRTDSGGEWRRGDHAERITCGVVCMPWSPPDQTDDDIFWDDLELRIDHVTATPEAVDAAAPARASLVAYPNPFNGSVMVRLDIPAATSMSVKIYDVRGRLVRDLFSGSVGSGRREIPWNGLDDRGAVVATGVYLVRVVMDGGDSQMGRVLFVK